MFFLLLFFICNVLIDIYVSENVSRLLLGMPVTYSYPLDSGGVVHNAGLFSNESSWIDAIDISIESWSGFYEVEILKGGGTVLADIMDCSIVSNALHQDML